MSTQPSDILNANLAALRRVAPALADRLQAVPSASLEWSVAKSGLPTAVTSHAGKPLSLASRFDPRAEGDKLLANVDYQKHAAIVLLGVGLGYHVQRVAVNLGRESVMIVYEPDLSVFRAVLERIDHTSWLGRPNVILVDPSQDRGSFVARVEPFSRLLTQGTILVTHPPTRQLHPDAITAFGQMVTDVLAYCRTNIATTLVNATRTVQNLASNLPYYVAGANTNELHNAAKGFPAICVSAGPSLARNVHLLADPAVREKVIVITAQTTLKPLLDRGITPDFVTALDYSEISRRFYEGLPELPTVTLVAEPKVHPTVVANYPGPIRLAADLYLDKLIGGLAVPIVPIPHGATVAHLSFYLAQHLGCDPVIFIGQDLGFSDGLYYCPGTAIHDVWAPELNAFNTVEMLEWQRIVRHRHHLEKHKDIHGRDIYSDEQMLTYLKQFERDFSAAPQSIIDATEGGLPKQNTLRMSLADALARHAIRPTPKLPLPPRELDRGKLRVAAEHMSSRIREVIQIERLTRATIPLLHQLREHRRDRGRCDRLFEQIDRNRRRVEGIGDTFNLVSSLNTLGAFKRSRADRAIEHAGDDTDRRQELQIERDLENLDWLAQACVEAQSIFRGSLEQVEAQLGKPVGSRAVPGVAIPPGAVHNALAAKKPAEAAQA